jgi:succinate dehydrogenase/fumarate reductase flavoprotein subunit
MVSAMKRAHDEGRSFVLDHGEWGFKLAVPSARREAIQTAFPKIAGLLGAGEDPILVRPILHYYLGGFPVPTSHEGVVQGLFLAGEITTGLFGASRLMGTGLLDSLVGGIVAGRNAAARARAEPGARCDLPLP